MENTKHIGWMWYPGDMEIYHGMLQNFSREERGYDWPAFWWPDNWNHRVLFERTYELQEETRFTVHAKGIGNVVIKNAGTLRDINVNEVKYPLETELTLGPGAYTVTAVVGNMSGLPCAFVEGEVIHSDEAWTASNDLSSGPVGHSCLFRSLTRDPNEVPYSYREVEPAACTEKTSKAGNEGTLVDFGCAVNGSLKIDFDRPEGTPQISYGESDEEALDEERCYYFEKDVKSGTVSRRRAFRYIFVRGVKTTEFRVTAVHSYVDIPVKAAFRSDDELLNRIFDVAVETFRQCSGMFFIDGIKRDRWVWSGDAYQSYVVNPYIFFDKEINERTLLQLRGNLGIKQHLNTIVDYSMLWIIALKQQYEMTGDLRFIEGIYEKAEDLTGLLMRQTNELGFIYGRPQDWIFIDWADIDKEGTLAAEQVLLVKTYEVMAELAELVGRDGNFYREKKEALYENLLRYFWDEEKGAFIDSYESGRRHVTRHANIFAIYFDLADEAMREKIRKNVIMNPEIAEITTPYFKFFELETLCKLGDLDEVMRRMKEYWGGMLEKDAVTFWEEFDPAQGSPEQYAMYADPYGKSLCHAWGASPIYFIGKYFLGVRPTAPGYEIYTVEPKLQYFKALDAKVPVRGGAVRLLLKDGTFTQEFLPDPAE